MHLAPFARPGRASFRTALLIATSLRLVVAEGRARADESETVCEDPRVRIHGRVHERWLEAIVRACEDLAAMSDGDPSARVRIVAAGRELVVEVALQDGRSTLRRVREPTALKGTLEALLTVPARSATPAPTPTPTPAPAPRFAKEVREHTPAPPPPGQGFGVEIGGALGGRVAGGQLYASVAPAAFAQLRANDWLFGMVARWDVFQTRTRASPVPFEMETVAAGLSIARRFNVQIGTVDIGASPRLLSEEQSFEGLSGEKTVSQTDVRLGTFTRAAIGGAAVTVFLELDAEVSPGRIRRDVRLDPVLPLLPSWSAGFAAGVVWGAQ